MDEADEASRERNQYTEKARLGRRRREESPSQPFLSYRVPAVIRKRGERKGLLLCGTEARGKERKEKEWKKGGKKQAPFIPPDLELFYNLVLHPRWRVGTGFAPTAAASHHVWLPREKEHPQDNSEWLNLFSNLSPLIS